MGSRGGPGYRWAAPSAGRFLDFGSARSILVGTEDLSAGPGHQGGNRPNGDGLLQEVHRAVSKQGVRAAGVERVDLVVAGAVNHAGAAPVAARLALRAGQPGVGERVGPGSAACGDWLDDSIDEKAIGLEEVDLPRPVIPG